MKLKFNLKGYFFIRDKGMNAPEEAWYTHANKSNTLFRLNPVELIDTRTNFKRYKLKRLA